MRKFAAWSDRLGQEWTAIEYLPSHAPTRLGRGNCTGRKKSVSTVPRGLHVLLSTVRRSSNMKRDERTPDVAAGILLPHLCESVRKIGLRMKGPGRMRP